MEGHTSPENIPTTYPKVENEILPNKDTQHEWVNMDNMVVSTRKDGPAPTPPIKD